MPRRAVSQRPKRNRRKKRSGARSRPPLLANARWMRRLRAFSRLSARLKLALGATVLFWVWLGANWTYQVIHKPTELLFPVGTALGKTPAETWHSYASLFRKHSTAVMTPELLAAIAQIEGSGNPVAHTYWRWALTLDPFSIYRPASSAVGMYQVTDATFADARRYCIHGHEVAMQGPWLALRSCWFNGLYTRIVPSHAIELTAAYLDHSVARVLEEKGVGGATLEQKQHLAAAIHLCGATGAARYLRAGHLDARGRRCGSHDLGAYLARVDAMKRRFAALARASGNG